MRTADDSDATATPRWTVEEILKRFPADPNLMSSPEGDKRGLEKLRRKARERIESISAESEGRGTA